MNFLRFEDFSLTNIMLSVIAQILVLMSVAGIGVGQTVFTIPAIRPANAAVLDVAPVAVS